MSIHNETNPAFPGHHSSGEPSPEAFSQEASYSNNRGGRENCFDLLDVLYEYVHGGCDENIRAMLQYHVESCPTCFEHLGVEREVRQLLRSRCEEIAPQELRTRITTQLRVVYRSN